MVEQYTLCDPNRHNLLCNYLKKYTIILFIRLNLDYYLTIYLFIPNNTTELKYTIEGVSKIPVLQGQAHFSWRSRSKEIGLHALENCNLTGSLSAVPKLFFIPIQMLNQEKSLNLLHVINLPFLHIVVCYCKLVSGL